MPTLTFTDCDFGEKISWKLDGQSVWSHLNQANQYAVSDAKIGESKMATAAEHPPFEGTAFQVKVWNAMKEIPRGETRTYTEIAIQIGHPNSARAVANACGQNPYPPIVPCHRVIRSDGSLGGYSGVGGVETKRRLLSEEGVTII